MAVRLMAVPVLVQVCFNSGRTYLPIRWLKAPHNAGSPGALGGASNFFELAVAMAITRFGPVSRPTRATVAGLRVEMPVLLSVCIVCNRTWGGE